MHFNYIIMPTIRTLFDHMLWLLLLCCLWFWGCSLGFVLGYMVWVCVCCLGRCCVMGWCWGFVLGYVLVLLVWVSCWFTDSWGSGVLPPVIPS